MSAGYVSGAVALFLETHPMATPDEVAEQIKRNATPNVLRDTRSTYSRMLYVGTRDAQEAVGALTREAGSELTREGASGKREAGNAQR
jgi:hypothetical protein